MRKLEHLTELSHVLKIKTPNFDDNCDEVRGFFGHRLLLCVLTPSIRALIHFRHIAVEIQQQSQ